MPFTPALSKACRCKVMIFTTNIEWSGVEQVVHKKATRPTLDAVNVIKMEAGSGAGYTPDYHSTINC